GTPNREASMRKRIRKELAAAAMAVLAFTGGAAGAAESEGLAVVLHVTDLAVGVLLGRVIAHEVGHLLLTRLDHEQSGIMTAAVPTDMRAVKR
ncbi:MAG: hypothetical protein ABI837_13580, partial [Acidobacteriota bacterium]